MWVCVACCVFVGWLLLVCWVCVDRSPPAALCRNCVAFPFPFCTAAPPQPHQPQLTEFSTRSKSVASWSLYSISCENADLCCGCCCCGCCCCCCCGGGACCCCACCCCMVCVGERARKARLAQPPRPPWLVILCCWCAVAACGGEATGGCASYAKRM